MIPVLLAVLMALTFYCDAQNNDFGLGRGNSGGAIDLGGGRGAFNFQGGYAGPVNVGGGSDDTPVDLGGGGGAGESEIGFSLPGVDVGVGVPAGDVNLGGSDPLTIRDSSPTSRSEGVAGGDKGVRSDLLTEAPSSGPGIRSLDLSDSDPEATGSSGALNPGETGTGSSFPPLNLKDGSARGQDTTVPNTATELNRATGGISIDEGSGTVNLNTGPEIITNTPSSNNNKNSNNDNNVNNAGPSPNFGAGAGGFGNINFPDFTSNFGNIGDNFPTSSSNAGRDGGLEGNVNGNNNNNDVFGNFPSFGSTIGTGGRLPNPNVLPNNKNNNNANNIPRDQRFPTLDLNNNFNFGNAGTGAGIRFPGDFNSNTFTGLDNIRFPPFSNANNGGFGEECLTPEEEPLPYKVDNSSVPQQVLQQIQQEFGLRPELQLIAQWFSATQGQPAALPKDSIDQVSCPADYHIITRFVSAQNAECFVLPPPTQDPVVYAKCRSKTMPKKRRRSAFTAPRRVRAQTLDLDQDKNDQDTLDLPQLPQAFVYDMSKMPRGDIRTSQPLEPVQTCAHSCSPHCFLSPQQPNPDFPNASSNSNILQMHVGPITSAPWALNVFVRHKITFLYFY